MSNVKKYLLRGRWCVIGPVCGRSAVLPRCSVTPSPETRQRWSTWAGISAPTVRYPYMIGREKQITKKKLNQKLRRTKRKKKKSSPKSGGVLITWERNNCLHCSGSSLRRFPRTRKQSRTSPECVWALSAVSGDANKLYDAGNNTSCRSQSGPLLPTPLSICLWLPQPPSPYICEVCLIGWQLVEGWYVIMGGSLWWEEGEPWENTPWGEDECA